MLTKENIKQLQEEGYSFEDIQNLIYRLEKIENGEAEFISEEDFWKEIYFGINNNLIKQQCIK